MTDTIEIKEFRPEDMPLSCTLICIGPPGSGKSSFMENMAYYKKHLYPVARIFNGDEDGYKKLCKVFPPLYVSNYWNEEEEKKHIIRQKKCVMESKVKVTDSTYSSNQRCYGINIIDDATPDTKVFKTPMFKSLFKIGSQHWAQLFMLGTQYAIDLPPEIRMAVSYVAIGREPNELNRKKLYNNFGGICGTYDNFCNLLDQLTGDYTFMVIKMRSHSNSIADNVFWYKTRQLGSWKFGCKEYREWAEQRYDSNYKEEILF